MRHIGKAILTGFCMILVVLFSATHALALSGGSPSQPPGTPPYGMAIHGDVAGTKLNGVFTMNFSSLFCSGGISSPACAFDGPDSAYANGTLRLRKGSILKSFTMDFGAVPINDIATLQTLVMSGFKDPIISAFFNEDPSILQMYLKELSEFSMDYTYDPGAAIGTYIMDPLDPDPGHKIVSFTATSDVVVAVK